VCNNNAKHVFSHADVNTASYEACDSANESFHMYLNVREVRVAAASSSVKRSVKNSLGLSAIVTCRDDGIVHSAPNGANKTAIERHTCIEYTRR
jgi:hypothetical protein